jgi:hypothetical protein
MDDLENGMLSIWKTKHEPTMMQLNVALLQIKRRGHFPGGNVGFSHLTNKKMKYN